MQSTTNSFDITPKNTPDRIGGRGSERNSPDFEHMPEEDIANLPVKLHKILRNISNLKTRLLEHRKETSAMCAEMVSLEKSFEKYASKLVKQQTKTTAEKPKRKPSGFASPTVVSPDLCIFMGKPVGTLISRTETSKFLSTYITENHLYNENNKSVILPDENLQHLLGNPTTETEITYFTIQKYINRHFAKQQTQTESCQQYITATA
jgi:chromatin remodeling complex protein RSC6